MRGTWLNLRLDSPWSLWDYGPLILTRKWEIAQDFVVYGSPLDLLFYDLSGIYFERLMPYSVPFVSFILIPDLPKKNLVNQKRNVSNWKQFSIIKFLAFHKQIQHYLLLFPTQKKNPKTT